MQQRIIHAGPLMRPVVIAERCAGCKTCIKYCKGNVLAFDRATRLARVKDSRSCPLECRTCARLCPTGAFTFADEEAFAGYLKKRLEKIKHELAGINDFLIGTELTSP